MLLSNEGGSESCRESIVGEQIARSGKDSARAKMCEEENILV
jgi:hypothetical protein